MKKSKNTKGPAGNKKKSKKSKRPVISMDHPTGSAQDLIAQEEAVNPKPEPVELATAERINVVITDPMIDTTTAINKLKQGQQNTISYGEYLTLPVPVNLERIRKDTHIMIATPCYGGMIGSAFMRSMLQTQNLFNTAKVKFSFLSIDNESLVTRARNTLLAMFLASPQCTHLMFIDADIGWDGTDILRMLHWDKEVICGAYPKKGIKWADIKKAVLNDKDIDDAQMEWYSSNYVVNVKWVDNPNKEGTKMASIDAEGNVEVDDAGTGFMIIKRQVIEKMIKQMPELKYVNDMPLPEEVKKHSYSLFDTSHCPDTGRYLSEDYTFCRRWQKMGGEIWIDPRTQLSHWGGHTYKGNISKIFQAGAVAKQK
tara:strand:+ start:179 stop:1285 length:1107 start_codon:yes stop_codon:yes gene_type:complete